MRTQLPAQVFGVRVETKTQDGVFVQLVLAIHYFRLVTNADGSFDEREEATSQIAAAVCDAVDASVSEMVIDDVLERKELVAQIVKTAVAPLMRGFGYALGNTLVTDVRMRGSRDRWAEGVSLPRGIRPHSRSQGAEETLATRWLAIVKEETI